jgi:hypothetical protein
VPAIVPAREAGAVKRIWSSKPARDRALSRGVSKKEMKTDVAQEVTHRRLQQQRFQEEASSW